MQIFIFPLAGAILYPGLQLHLHIFEPRYCAMVSDALARDRRIGMIQPHNEGTKKRTPEPLFTVGCLGHIAQFETTDDGGYHIVLEGETRYRLVSEMQVSTPFRQFEAEALTDKTDVLAGVERAAFEIEARHFAVRHDYHVDWETVARLDDRLLINSVSAIAPFDAAAKQALLEADSLSQRCVLLIQLMQFFAQRDGGSESATLQ